MFASKQLLKGSACGQEVNGLVTYDRVAKLPKSIVVDFNQQLKDATWLNCFGHLWFHIAKDKLESSWAYGMVTVMFLFIVF